MLRTGPCRLARPCVLGIILALFVLVDGGSENVYTDKPLADGYSRYTATVPHDGEVIMLDETQLGESMARASPYSSGAIKQLVKKQKRDSDATNIHVQLSKGYTSRIDRMKSKLVKAEEHSEASVILKMQIREMELARAKSCKNLLSQYSSSGDAKRDLEVIKTKLKPKLSASRTLQMHDLSRSYSQDLAASRSTAAPSYSSGKPSYGSASYGSAKPASVSYKAKCEEIMAELKARKVENNAVLVHKELAAKAAKKKQLKKEEAAADQGMEKAEKKVAEEKRLAAHVKKKAAEQIAIEKEKAKKAVDDAKTSVSDLKRNAEIKAATAKSAANAEAATIAEKAQQDSLKTKEKANSDAQSTKAAADKLASDTITKANADAATETKKAAKSAAQTTDQAAQVAGQLKKDAEKKANQAIVSATNSTNSTKTKPSLREAISTRTKPKLTLFEDEESDLFLLE